VTFPNYWQGWEVPYPHDRVPWQYETELLGHIGVERDEPLLSERVSFEQSGWFIALKMLEQQLRFLTLIVWKRNGNFFGPDLSVHHLKAVDLPYGDLRMPSWEAVVKHPGCESYGYNVYLKQWIDLLRLDYGLPAFPWSDRYRAGGTIVHNLLKETWAAAGLVFWESGANQSPQYHGGNYYWYTSKTGPIVDTWKENFRYISFYPAETRISDVASIVLFRHGGEGVYTGNNDVILCSCPDTSTAEAAFNYTGGSILSIFNTLGNSSIQGAAGSWQYRNLTTVHPTYGSDPVAYIWGLKTIDVVDSSFIQRFTSIDPSAVKTYLWQPALVNPYG